MFLLMYPDVGAQGSSWALLLVEDGHEQSVLDVGFHSCTMVFGGTPSVAILPVLLQLLSVKEVHCWTSKDRCNHGGGIRVFLGRADGKEGGEPGAVSVALACTAILTLPSPLLPPLQCQRCNI